MLVVTPWFPGASTPSSGVFVQREVHALLRKHDVHVVHLDWQGHTPLRGAEHEYTHVPLTRSNPRSYARARSLVRRLALDADIVHTHALTSLVPWLSGRPGTRSVPWIHSEHWSGISSPETLSIPHRLVLRVLARVLRRPDEVIAESSRLAAGISSFGRPDVPIVPCVVPATPVTPPPGDGEQLRLVGIGSMIARKGALIAVAAVDELRTSGVSSHLTWVGDGPQRGEIEEEVRRRGMGHLVTLPGTLDSAGVGACLDMADIFILPTQGDNFCVVAAEALMHGRPIVIGHQSGAVDYADSRTARFVHEQTGSAYAAAVRHLRTELTLTAEDIAFTVRGRFSPERVCDALTSIYAAHAGDRVHLKDAEA